VYIRSALRQKGLAPGFIQDALKDVVEEEDPLEAACRAVKTSSAFRRKPKAGEDPRRRVERCYAFLARRGFSPSLIVPVLRKALKEDVEAS
jgi:SOS response regulatory protein OraA/RecX